MYAGSHAGKSHAAAKMYLALDETGYNVELSREFAKEKVYERNNAAISCEPLILGQELYNIEKLIDYGVDYIVCDCPLLLPAFYNKTRSKTMELFALELSNQFDNVNFFVERDPTKFETKGRIHSLEESIAMDKKILAFFHYYDVPYQVITHQTIIDGDFLVSSGIV